MPLSFRHIVSTRQFSREDVDIVFGRAREMEVVLAQGGSKELEGCILASLFYEPSTRTRFSFAAAMHRLGGQVLGAEGVQFSSLYKGETLEDTIRVVSQYADVICMRHGEKGSAEKAAAVSSVPFINGGDGPGEHPTQALLDLYTIQKERGGIDGVHIAMAGDLLYGRTVHSLSTLLSLYPHVQCTFISPPELSLPEEVYSFLREREIVFSETEALKEGIDADVLYMTRIQRERFSDPQVYDRLKGVYALRASDLQGRKTTIMHPLPRVGEIAPDVDTLPNAAYFRQVRNGVAVRMALLSLLLGKV